MTTHVKLVGGEELAVQAPLGEVAAALNSDARLVALTSSYGGTVYVNPHQVLFLEEPPELGLGKVEEASDPEVPQPPPTQPPSSQAPPGL